MAVRTAATSSAGPVAHPIFQPVNDSVFPADEIVTMAEEYFVPGAIVIGHLNHEPVTQVYGRLVDLIRERRLRTVTLRDVYLS